MTLRRVLIAAYIISEMLSHKSCVGAIQCYYCTPDLCAQSSDHWMRIHCEASDSFSVVCASINVAADNGTIRTYKSCLKSVKGICDRCNDKGLERKECVLCNSAYCRYNLMEPESTLCFTNLDANITACEYCSTDLCNDASHKDIVTTRDDELQDETQTTTAVVKKAANGAVTHKKKRANVVWLYIVQLFHALL